MASKRFTLLAAAAFAALVGGSGGLAAQGVGTVRGKVLDAATQRPLAGAQISIPGSGKGALTNGAGEYVVANVPVGAQDVRADMLGYKQGQQSVTVTAGQAVTADFALSQTAISMDELVVTGTAGPVSKRTLGNSITKLDAAELTQKTVVSNIAELLQSKAPGVQLLVNSGVPGTAGEIRIRGAGSLAVSNAPVVYVDGVRYNTGSYGQFTPSGAGATSFRGHTTSALDGIDPNDIESIEVLKGPAAATLYGAEAASGVIQIITKKGKAGQQPLQWNAKVEMGGNDWSLPIPNNYTTCDASRVADPNTWPGCAGKAPGTVLVGNPLRDDPNALRTGAVRRFALQVHGGGDNFSYYIAGNQDNEDGVFQNSFADRRSIRANFQLTPSEKVDLSASTNYARSKIRLPLGDESAESMLLSAFRGRPGHVPPGGRDIRDGWGTTAAAEANNYDNETTADRLTLGSTLNYRPFSWFRNRVTLGLDYTGSFAQVLSPPGSVDADYAGFPDGLVAQRTPRNYIYTVDYAGNLDHRLMQDLLATTSFGAQFVSKRYEQLNATGIGLAVPDVTLIGTAQETNGGNTFSENKSFGFYGQEQFGWKDRLYLTGALRVDNNSSFGDEINRRFYPKASLAYVISDEPSMKSLFESAHVNNLKLRAAWGQAGRAPDPYLANQVYSVSRVIQGDQVASTINVRAIGNPNLKPERGEEFEAGFDAGLFNDRAGLEFTYYHKKMSDVLVLASVPGSSGFGGTFVHGVTSPFENLGSTLNTGVELTLNANPILTRNFSWDTRVNLGTNSNKLVSFGDPARKSLSISGQSYGAVQQHREGFPLGGYWAAMPKRNEDGSLVINPATGLAVADTASYIGPSAPTRVVSWSNTVTFLKNFRVFALFDYNGGFYNFNAKEYQRCRVSSQLNCERVNDPANVDLTNMDLTKVPPKNEDVRVWRAAIPGPWVEQADFIKFRDLSLTYTVPQSLLTPLRVRALTLTAAAHNLGIVWTKYSGIDPEVNSYGDVLYNSGSNGFARADVYPMPMIRRFTVSANVSF